jgi:DNA N-6-adenine-methyltransferase (Dam)
MGDWELPGESNDWLTPKYIFTALSVQFELDVASNPKQHTPTIFGGPCDHGLEFSWNHPTIGRPFFIWMNPPFGGRNGIFPWLRKFVEHGNGVALMPDRTSSPWFQWVGKRVNHILFVSPKIRFERLDGSIGNSPSCGTALMSLGIKGEEALINAERNGLGLLVNP